MSSSAKSQTYRRWRKRFFIALSVGGVAAGIGWAMRPRPEPVDTAKVVTGPLAVWMQADGRIVDPHPEILRAPVGGKVELLIRDKGSAVQAEQEIARIYPMQAPLLDARSRDALSAQLAVANASYRQSRQSISQAQVELDTAKRQLDRTQSLHQRGSISDAELDRSVSAHGRALAAVEAARLASQAAKQQVAVVQAQLEGPRDNSPTYLSVFASKSGVLSQIYEPSPNYVMPGAPLVELVSLEQLEAVVDVLSQETYRIKPGQEVELFGWGSDASGTSEEPAKLAATVEKVEPVANTRISALGVEEERVDIHLKPQASPALAQLGHGYRTQARIKTWSQDNVTIAPLSAVFRDEGKWWVFTVNNGTNAKRREVTIDHRQGNQVEIVSGVQSGDTLIIFPSEKLLDGALVQPSSTAKATQ